MTDNMKAAIEAMGFEPNTTINLLDEPMVEPHLQGGRSYQRHVAIEWEGGVLWLNMFDLTNGERPHYCIDVRQINSGGMIKGQGVFTMARGYRGSIATIESGPEMVKGANWDGGYLVAILTDPDGQETHTDKERE